MSSIYEELGVSPALNAHGNRTLLGGGTPSPAVRALMEEASEYYADMGDLVDRVGERIAEMLDIEAVLVTSGCSAALAVGAAACMTGADREKIERIPDTSGMPREFIIQRQLRVAYDRCMTIPGGALVEVGEPDGTTPEHIEEAIGPDTAGIHYLALGDVPGFQSQSTRDRPGAVPIQEVIEIAHSHDLPVIVDAAGEVYPTDKLSKYVKMGADLVAYGAKYFGAVNSSGMLTGRKELVEAARMHSFIGFEAEGIRSFGRPMKLDRQEVVAVYAALREWLTMNHEDRIASYESRIDTLRRGLDGAPGIEIADYPGGAPADGLRISIDPDGPGKTAAEVVGELRSGTPSIWVREDGTPHSFVVRMPTLKEGGESIIAARLLEILRGPGR